jgi:hypothetical protein
MHHLTVTAGADGLPQLGTAPVTVTRWQPEERKY